MYPRFDELDWATPYGVMLVVALFACWWHARRRAIVRGIDPSQVDLAVPVIFAAAVLGAQALGLAGLSEISVGGDLLGPHRRSRVFVLLPIAAVCLLAYSRVARLSFRSLADLFALPALLWLAIVRIGCLMAGCCWGDVTVPLADLDRTPAPAVASQLQTVPALAGLPIGIRFPSGSFAFDQHVAGGLIAPDAAASLPVHATQLYELVLVLLLLFALARIEARQRPGRLGHAGSIAAVTLAGYGLLRFALEFLRADNTPVIGVLTSVQLACIVAVLVCPVMLACYQPSSTPPSNQSQSR